MDIVLSDLILQFLTDCYSSTGLGALMKTAHKYFGNACVLMDSSYKTLFHIGGTNINDQTWREISQDGYFSKETLSTFISEGLITNDFRLLYPCYSPTIYDEGHAGNVRRMSIAIPSRSDIPSGWFTVFEETRPITEVDKTLLSWFAKVLAPQMESFVTNKSQPFGRIENLMLDILNNSGDRVFRIEDNLQALGWKSLNFNRILLIEPAAVGIPNAMYEYIIRILKQHFYSVFDFMYNGYLMVVLCSDKDLFKETCAVDLTETFEKFGLYGGFSAPFMSISFLKHHYSQVVNCLNASKFCGRRERLLYFEDYAVDAMIYLASQHFDIREYCHPYLLTLRAYDKTHQTQYVDTLRKYISNTKNLNSAARELHIHRNTMSYRIEKIQEILQIDSIDQKLMSDLHMSFIIYDICGLAKENIRYEAGSEGSQQ